MDALNYVVLIAGLFLIGLYWNLNCPAGRKKETRIVTVSLFFLGIAVYYMQSTLWPV